jgi:hypothetical protein
MGVRTCKGDPYKDPYLSSSRVVKKMRSDGYTFHKTVLEIYPTRQEAVAAEILFHEENNVANNPRYLNLAKQTSTKFDFDATGLKRSEASKLKYSQCKQGDLNPSKQDWVRKKLSESHKGLDPWNKGKENPKQSEINRKIFKGRHWFNNGVMQTMAFTCPHGWVKGRIHKTQKEI